MKMVEETIAQAGRARNEILAVITKAIAFPKKEVSKYAPTILSTYINPEKIGLVVGPGGKTINAIIARTGASDINIEQTGQILVTAGTKEAAEAAMKEVEGIVKEYKVGDMVEGEVIKILDFGAIVDLGGGNDGMIHVSELKDGYVKKVEDVVKIGDRVNAKVVRAEDGRIGLSLKGIPQLQ